MVKKIGLIGGLSPESTIHYYEIICREFNRRFGELQFPELTLESLNLQNLIRRFDANDWNGVGEILLGAISRLQQAGADFAAILANTPHNAYDLIRDRSPLPIVTIMDAIAAALLADRRERVGLLGTRPTMEYGFFQKHFQSQGIETVVPDEQFRRQIDRIIWDELSHGVIKPESQTAARLAIKVLTDEGCEGIVLACTELSLLIKSEDSAKPLYDTTQLHARAILDFALN